MHQDAQLALEARPGDPMNPHAASLLTSVCDSMVRDATKGAVKSASELQASSHAATGPLRDMLAGALIERAAAQLRLGKAAHKAAADAKRAVELLPARHETRLMRARVHLQEGRAGEAVKDLDVALRAKSSCVTSRMLRAQAHLQFGSVDKAEEDTRYGLAMALHLPSSAASGPDGVVVTAVTALQQRLHQFADKQGMLDVSGARPAQRRRIMHNAVLTVQQQLGVSPAVLELLLLRARIALAKQANMTCKRYASLVLRLLPMHVEARIMRAVAARLLGKAQAALSDAGVAFGLLLHDAGAEDDLAVRLGKPDDAVMEEFRNCLSGMERANRQQVGAVLSVKMACLQAVGRFEDVPAVHRLWKAVRVAHVPPT